MRLLSDDERVLEIDRYQVLLEPPRADLMALVDVAAQVAQVPLATINLITDTEQHQIATAGFDASICAREDSMCNLVLHEKEPVIVPDASQDPRFRDNPFVTGEIGDVRFYATHQLRTPAGVVIGTLCVFDTEPRELGDDQEADVATQTRQVLAKIAARLAEGGTDKSKLLWAQLWVTDMRNFAAMNEAWDAWIDPANPPVRAGLCSARLEGRDHGDGRQVEGITRMAVL